MWQLTTFGDSLAAVLFETSAACLSWDYLGDGGITRICAVANLTVDHEHCHACTRGNCSQCAERDRERVARELECDVSEVVLLFTTVPQIAGVSASVEGPDGLAAFAYCTCGLGTALAIGEVPGLSEESSVSMMRAGTVNVTVAVNRSMQPKAMLEAMAMAERAKTQAILEAGLFGSNGILRLATGTDCVAICSAPDARFSNAPLEFAGMHTALGQTIVRAVYETVTKGVAMWRSRPR